jgi:hypothetical protein
LTADAFSPVVTDDAKPIRMTWARWILVVALLAAQAAGQAPQAKTEAPAPSGDINVNPYGDPIWQTAPARSRPQRHVKRPRPKPQVHARRARAKPGRHAGAANALQPDATPFGRPLNILPPAARAKARRAHRGH